MAGRQPNLWDITAAGRSRSTSRSRRRSASMASSRSCRSIRRTPRSRQSRPAPTTTTCARTPSSVRNFRHAVVIGFGHEMNAPWYSWGYRHVPAATFVAAWRHIVTLFRRSGRGQRHLAVDARGRSGEHRADRLLVAGRAVRHLGRHRRLLLPLLRHLRQRLRPDHHSGAGLHQQAGAAVGDCGRARRRPVRQDPGPVPAGWPRTRRSGWCGSTRPSTAGLTDRTGGSKTTCRPRFPSGWVCVTN